jgi:hypothetical protein
MHGPANISGVVYTPSYSEIENKPTEGFNVANQIQYFKGSLIVGMGIYLQNNNASTTIVSFDPRTVDSLATMGGAGKTVNWPFCRSLTATLLLGFWHFMKVAAPIAVSIVSRQYWVLPSSTISNLAPKHSALYVGKRAL